LKAKDVLVRGEKKEIKRLLWRSCTSFFFAPIYSSWNLVYRTSATSFPLRLAGLEKKEKYCVANKPALDIARAFIINIASVQDVLERG